VTISRGALAGLTPFEIEILLAKEEAARRLEHPAIMVLLITLVVLVVLFVADFSTPYICKGLKTPPPPDSRSLPILVTTVILGIIISIPFLTGVNRYLESKAAESAITNTRKPITAIDLYRKQVEFNLSAAQPNGILHLLIDPHPAATDNIAQARTLRQELAP
jgi:Zn-dependent protease with chaperone function